MEKHKTTVHIEFISDYICPWCYIGKARLERVRETLANEIDLEIELKPYLLYPAIPIGGVDKSVFSKKTKPGMGRSLKAESKIESIEINYKNIERIPNSLEAHRLTWLTKPSKKYELAKRIFHGYFEEGQDIEHHDFLIEQAQKVGIDKNTIGKFFSTDAGKTEVAKAIQDSKNEFITVVPSLRLDHQFLIPGLQSDDVWEKYIRRAAEIQNTKSKEI